MIYNTVYNFVFDSYYCHLRLHELRACSKLYEHSKGNFLCKVLTLKFHGLITQHHLNTTASRMVLSRQKMFLAGEIHYNAAVQPS